MEPVEQINAWPYWHEEKQVRKQWVTQRHEYIKQLDSMVVEEVLLRHYGKEEYKKVYLELWMELQRCYYCYDHQQGLSFVQYAQYVLNRTCRRRLGEQQQLAKRGGVRIPARDKKLLALVEQFLEKKQLSLAEVTPSLWEQLANSLGITVKKIQQVYQQQQLFDRMVCWEEQGNTSQPLQASIEEQDTVQWILQQCLQFVQANGKDWNRRFFSQLTGRCITEEKMLPWMQPAEQQYWQVLCCSYISYIWSQPVQCLADMEQIHLRYPLDDRHLAICFGVSKANVSQQKSKFRKQLKDICTQLS